MHPPLTYLCTRIQEIWPLEKLMQLTIRIVRNHERQAMQTNARKYFASHHTLWHFMNSSLRRDAKTQMPFLEWLCIKKPLNSSPYSRDFPYQGVITCGRLLFCFLKHGLKLGGLNCWKVHLVLSLNRASTFCSWNLLQQIQHWLPSDSFVTF